VLVRSGRWLRLLHVSPAVCGRPLSRRPPGVWSSMMWSG